MDHTWSILQMTNRYGVIFYHFGCATLALAQTLLLFQGQVKAFSFALVL